MDELKKMPDASDLPPWPQLVEAAEKGEYFFYGGKLHGRFLVPINPPPKSQLHAVGPVLEEYQVHWFRVRTPKSDVEVMVYVLR